MTKLSLAADLSLVRLGAFTDLDVTADVGVSVALLPFAALELWEVVGEATA